MTEATAFNEMVEVMKWLGKKKDSTDAESG